FGQQVRAGVKTLKIRRGEIFDLQIPGVDFQILANYNECFDTIFESFGQQVRAGVKTLKIRRCEIFDLQIPGVDLQILANYLQNFGNMQNFVRANFTATRSPMHVFHLHVFFWELATSVRPSTIVHLPTDLRPIIIYKGPYFSYISMAPWPTKGVLDGPDWTYHPGFATDVFKLTEVHAMVQICSRVNDRRPLRKFL
ncbi:Uncharacterized protein FWK35_00032801, partial [Aphis craccivora]